MISYGPSSPRNVRRYEQVNIQGRGGGWKLASVITKAGDGWAVSSRVHDTHVLFILNPTRIHTISPYIRVSQVNTKISSWFEKDLLENMRHHLRSYTIMSMGAAAGIIGCLTISRSVDEIK